MRNLFWLYFIAALGTANAAERWFVIQLDGEPAGFEHMTIENLDGDRVRTTKEMTIVIHRFGTRFETNVKTTTTENLSGALISVRQEVARPDQTVTTEAEIQGDAMQVRTTAGTISDTRSISLSAPLCGPVYFTRITREQLQMPGDAVTCRLYEPTSGPFRSTRTLLGEEFVNGQKLLRVKMTTGDRQTGPVWLFDSEGNVFQSEQQIAGVKTVTRATDRETALKAAGGREAAENRILESLPAIRALISNASRCDAYDRAYNMVLAGTWTRGSIR